METVGDFEDLLQLLDDHAVRYLIIGGLAFIYHAKPRYTKDMDLWIDPSPENVRRANEALAAFGSPHLLTPGASDEILQLGLPPNRIDLLRSTGDTTFEKAWEERVVAPYGDVEANWIGLDSLIEMKRGIDHPRHQEDARILEAVQDRSVDDE